MSLNSENPYIRILLYSCIYQFVVYLIVVIWQIFRILCDIQFNVYPILFLNMVILMFTYDRFKQISELCKDGKNSEKEVV